MNKKFLTVILTSMASFSPAEVSLYGRVSVGLEADGFQNTSVPNSNSVQDFGSYFGINGHEHAYGQTSVIWQIEQFLDLTSGQSYYDTTGSGLIYPNRPGFSQNGRIVNEVNTLASSDSYLGLEGLWGSIRLGNLSNYMRSNMGNVDVYNYNNNTGVNGFTNYSRTSQLMPTTIRYDSPSWNGFSLAGAYSFQSLPGGGMSSVVMNSTYFSGGLNGNYSGGVYALGAGWVGGNFSAHVGTWIFGNVGSYTTGTSSNFCENPAACYQDAYANRLELAYNNPDNLILGLGFQTTSGLGWSGWATSGGSWNNYVTNQGYNYQGLSSNQYQTQEFGGTVGWHLGPWTPKIGYMYGNDLMYNGNITSVMAGSATSIPDSGYQQFVAELDWNLTPRTIVFINYGQVWYGSTMQNVMYCGTGCPKSSETDQVTGSNQFLTNQTSTAIGFSHTF